jgi:hypothetical protein
MERRLRLNLILLAAAGLLGLFVWQLRSPGLPPLTTLDAARVERIEISDLSGRHILLQKTAGLWRSGGAAADRERIAQLLRICDTPSLERFPAGDELAQFGLDPAPIRLRLDRVSLDIGAVDPLNGWRYVRIEERIHLIADGFYHHLTAPPEAWLETP